MLPHLLQNGRRNHCCGASGVDRRWNSYRSYGWPPSARTSSRRNKLPTAPQSSIARSTPSPGRPRFAVNRSLAVVVSRETAAWHHWTVIEDGKPLAREAWGLRVCALMCCPLAARMIATAIDIGGFLHRFASGAAVFAFRHPARTVRMSAFCDFGCHEFPPGNAELHRGVTWSLAGSNRHVKYWKRSMPAIWKSVGSRL